MSYSHGPSDNTKLDRNPTSVGFFLFAILEYHATMDDMYIYATLIILALALIIWILSTLYVVRGIEWPIYKREIQRDWYEIRKYEDYIVAEVVIEGNMKKALYAWFRQLAGYIFGGNISRTSIGVSATLETMRAPENIAMTVPVMESASGNQKHTIAFTMPSKYSLETLPQPNNPKIVLRNVPKSRKAVIKYSWYATEKRVNAKKKQLKDFLDRDWYIIKGEMISAQYNPPMSFPLLRRNEIMVDIE